MRNARNYVMKLIKLVRTTRNLCALLLSCQNRKSIFSLKLNLHNLAFSSGDQEEILFFNWQRSLLIKWKFGRLNEIHFFTWTINPDIMWYLEGISHLFPDMLLCRSLHSGTRGGARVWRCKQYLILIFCECQKPPQMGGKRLKQLQPLCVVTWTWLAVCQQMYKKKMCGKGFGRYKPQNLPPSPQRVRQEFPPVWFQDGGAGDIPWIQSCVATGPWECVPRGCRWEEIWDLASFLHVSPHILF